MATAKAAELKRWKNGSISMLARSSRYGLMVICGVLLAIYGLGLIAAPTKARHNETANSSGAMQANVPSFLEKGKSYYFNFPVSAGEYPTPVTITARVEKIEAESGWVYIQHYNSVRKGKSYELQLSGFSWINMRHVYQCSEAVIKPSA